MATISNQRIRLAIDVSQPGSTVNDVLTGNSPQFWNGVDLQFELGIFWGQALADISNFDSISVELKTASDRSGLSVMGPVTVASGSINNGLTLNNWNAGAPANCHALAVFTNSQTKLFLSADTVTFWLVVSALTNDSPAHKVVLCATPLNVVESGEGVTPPSYVTTPIYYTAAQSDARYSIAVDLTSINNSITTLNSEMTAVTTTANAAMPKAGGTFSGAITITGLSGVLKATTGLVSGSATTSDLTEGSNLYFTNARADARITAASGAASGVCPLDSGSKIPAMYLPAVAISNTYTSVSQAAMLALAADVGDVCIRTDVSETFILAATPAATLGNWKQMLSPTSAVTSVNTQTGAVTLTTANISEVTNLYYTTARAHTDAIAATLTGFSGASGGTVTSGDSILSALGRLENRCAVNDAKVTGSDRVKTDGSIAMTGMLNFTGTTQAGLKLNNLDATQIGALTAAAGMLVYNTTLSTPQFYNGSAWSSLGGGGGGGSTLLTGSGVPSSGTGTSGNFYLDSAQGDFYLKTGASWALACPQKLSLSGANIMTGGIQFGLGLTSLISYNGVQYLSSSQSTLSQPGVFPTVDYTIATGSSGCDKEARSCLFNLMCALSLSKGGHGIIG